MEVKMSLHTWDLHIEKKKRGREFLQYKRPVLGKIGFESKGFDGLK